jgi:hypothetical protein
MNLVFGGRAYGIVARLQPLEPDQGEPAIGFQHICGVLRAPRGGFLFESAVLGEERSGKQKARKNSAEMWEPMTGTHTQV